MTNPAHNLSITVEDNHGLRYTARVLNQGDAYGNGAKWGGVFYQEGRTGITIDGLPSTYFCDTIAAAELHPGSQLAIDSGQGWKLTAESTADFYAMARKAIAAEQPEPRYYVEEYRNEHGLNDWERRTQFLVFDRRGVGCMTSLGTKSAAQLIVDALNAYQPEGA